MSNFPNNFDDDSTLPSINDNISEIGGDAINALRDAVFNIEMNIGLNANGTTTSIAQRMGIFINPDGTPNASIIYNLGLVTLPVTNTQIAEAAGIPESKLTLDFPTLSLYNYIRDLSNNVNTALGWQSVSGSKLEPHLIGLIYRHDLAQIDVAEVSSQFLNNVFRVNRDNTNSYTLINDMNNELLAHQWADGSPFGTGADITTNNGSKYSSYYSHVASGIFLDTSRFVVIPETATDVQSFAEFFDSSSILALGTRVQNLYANGISVNSASSSLTTDGYGSPIVPVTPAIAFLRGDGNSSIPVDDIAIGDDIIQFMPTDDGYSFDEQFALVRPGDIVRVNYANDGYFVEVPYVISEKKYIQGSTSAFSTFIVRILGKNIAYAPNALARIDRPLFNNNKYGVLSTAGVNSPNYPNPPSLIIGTARGAECTGINFSPDQFNETHYLLHLALYPDGNPLDGYTFLPGIDVTGNQGTTPGSYTLDGIVDSTNIAFRQAGYNYRFIAFHFQGQFGIMIADSYNNASFSVVSGVVSPLGVYDPTNTAVNFPNNVIDVFPSNGSTAPDPLGFGPFNANLASPPFLTSYGSAQSALFPTILFAPLKRNNYYVNGAERETFNLDVGQALDMYGDGYWVATVTGASANAGPPGHMVVSYNIPLDLSASNLKSGKTIVVQQVPGGPNLGLVNYGRFIIQSVTFSCCPPVETQIVVYDGVHAQGSTPYPVLAVGSQVAIYFDNDSVSFDAETATDFSPVSATFKRFFEVYVDSNGNTYTHERGRLSISSPTLVNGIPLYTSVPSIAQLDIVSISPKLRGYQFASVTKITLSLASYNPVTGLFTGNLASYNGVSFTNAGPVTTGRIGEVTRFYDVSNIDYIDIIFDFGNTVPVLTNQYIDFQLFPSLQLDEEIMVLASCQQRTDTNAVSRFTDLRQFGNTSEQQLTTSALDYIALPERLLHFNGVIRGFDATIVSGGYGSDALLSLTGGLALVNGSFEAVNNQIFTIPPLQESYLSAIYPINYGLCVDDGGDLVTIVLTDYDTVNGTPNAPNRVVTVNNVVSSTSYQIDSATFSYILNDRKDLTLLYIVTAVVSGTGTGATTAITIRDVRRFAKDSDSSIPAVLTNDKSQGNFLTFASAITWLEFNSDFQNTLQIKGAYTIATDPGLNSAIFIEGAGVIASLTFSSNVVMSEVTFENLTLVFNGTLNATNVTFTNCNITFNGATTFSGVVIDPSTVAVNALIVTEQSSFLNSTFNVPITVAFSLESGSTFVGNTFNYSANPVGDGYYRTGDLVNSGKGMMYSDVSSTLTNLTITGNTFNTALTDHYAFLSLQLSTQSAIVQNANISNNQFISSATSNDYRAVIAITSTVTTLTFNPPVWPLYPAVVNMTIDSNLCNYDQMILFSTDRVPGTAISGPMLKATNCYISRNICGTIGFITAQSIASDSDNSNPANGGFVRNKKGQLVIEGNTCKFISNIDSLGDYIAFYPAFAGSPSSWVTIGTGPCAILNNTTNWIQVGCCAGNNGGSSDDGMLISGNRLSPNNSSYLALFTDTPQSGWTPDNVGILLRGETASASTTFGGITNSIIANNTISQNITLSVSVGEGSNIYYYYAAAIACYNNAIITGNSANGVVNSSTTPMVFLWGVSDATLTPNIRFSHNTLGRVNLLTSTIQAYVAGIESATNIVSITNNIFDSQFVDSGNTNNKTGLNIPDFWEFRNNTNQTFYVEFPLVDDSAMLSVGISGGVPGPPTSGVGVVGGVTPQGVILTTGTNGVNFERALNLSGGSTFIPNTQYTVIADLQNSSPEVTAFGKTFSLDQKIPPNCKLTNVAIGLGMITPTLSTSPFQQALNWNEISSETGSTWNCMTLTLMKYAPTNNNQTFGSVLDVFANVSYDGSTSPPSVVGDPTQEGNLIYNIFVPNSTVGGSQIAETAWRTSTQYAIIPISAFDYRTGQSYRIAISVDASFLKSTNAAAYLCLSPVVVTCVYGA
jgi:hypothetical protein